MNPIKFKSVGAGLPQLSRGTACGIPGMYWSEQLNSSSLHGYQASARSGVVCLRLRGDRSALMGGAVTIRKGELHV